jgi:hypothetical protein
MGDNFKMDLQETGWEGLDWIDLAWDRDKWWAFVVLVLYLQIP